jgi:hypothetical protein
MSTAAFTLSLFPNTGHQFFTIDLEDLLSISREARTATPPNPELIRQFVASQLPEGVQQADRPRLAGWLPWAETTPWILYRYEFLNDPTRDQLRAVLQLAIETNLGDIDRGTVFSLQHVAAGSPAPEHPLFEQLRQNKVEPPSPDAAAADSLYISRPNELHQVFDEGWMWLEDAFGGGSNVQLPRRQVRAGGRDLSFKLPSETVKIEFLQSQGETVNVDLIVDLGNTRTCALLLEDHGIQSEHAFGKRVEPVKFLPRGWSFGHPALDSALEPYGLIDSWILLHRSTFANLEPPFSGHKLRTYRTPVPGNPGKDIIAHLIDQRFVSLAPVLVGGGREPTGAGKTLARAVMARGAQEMPFFMSSPKRYAWDDTSIGAVKEYWRQVPNINDADKNELGELKGLIRYYMNPTRHEHDLPPASLFDAPFQPNTDYYEHAKYSRRDAICWFATSILESARTQINSLEFLLKSKLPRRHTLRRLRRVRVTFPSGWTGEEREAYLDQWRRAIRLFTAAHYADPKPTREDDMPPALVEDYVDEAIASQLPLLAAEVKTLGDEAPEWLMLYGDGSEARVMNIDIGGGTTDIAVVRYCLPEQRGGRDNQSAVPVLQAELLDKDGSSLAGDRLVKRVIESLVIPVWLGAGNKAPLVNNPKVRELVTQLFTTPGQAPIQGLDPDACAKLSRIVRLVFVPMANEILARLREAETTGSVNLSPLRPLAAADKTAIEELNHLVLELVVHRSQLVWPPWGTAETKEMKFAPKFESRFRELYDATPARMPFPPAAELQITVAEVNALVEDVFKGLLDQVAGLAARHNCDLVILSGKPSELARVREMVVRRLPLPPQRIIEVKGYRVGSWYPPCLVESGGRIRDAKTVTVTGAALYEDIKNRNTRGLRVNLPVESAKGGARNNWGVLKEVGDNVDPANKEDPLFSLGQASGSTKEINLALQSLLGRWNEEGTHSELVYRLEYELLPNESRPEGLLEQNVRMRLRLAHSNKTGEGLEIVEGSVSFPEATGEGFRPERVRLKLRTLVEKSFWMDEPAFKVSFARALENPQV